MVDSCYAGFYQHVTAALLQRLKPALYTLASAPDHRFAGLQSMSSPRPRANGNDAQQRPAVRPACFTGMLQRPCICCRCLFTAMSKDRNRMPSRRQQCVQRWHRLHCTCNTCSLMCRHSSAPTSFWAFRLLATPVQPAAAPVLMTSFAAHSAAPDSTSVYSM